MTGYQIEVSRAPQQFRVPNEARFSPSEALSVRSELDKLLKKGVIETCTHEPGEFISPIFLREKKDGTYRVILNLKALNEFIVDQHFKMETLDAVTNIMKRGAYAASLDLKEAYYSGDPYIPQTQSV